MVRVANIPLLRKKLRKRARRRQKAWEKYRATGDRGYLKWFKAHRKAARKLRRLIDRAVRRQEFASTHFRYSEFNCHQGDPVPEYMYPHLADLCDWVLEPLRAKFGPCHITSGHRWSWYNAAINGASASYHVYESRKAEPAADLIFAKGTPAEWAAAARALGVGGVGQYDRSGFVHTDTGPRRDWWG